MLFLHDVWVNWFEGEENSYNIHEFHEWRSTDSVFLLDQVPLLKVEEDFYHFIEDNLIELPSELLSDILNKSYVRENYERILKPYCFVISDGIDVLAVDTLGYNLPLKKSKLVPRQHEIAINFVTGPNIKTNKYPYNKNYKNLKIYNNLSLEPTYMIGLTRREKTLKQLLFIALDTLSEDRNLSKIKYLYSEFNIKNYNKISNLSFDEIYCHLLNELKEGWTAEHEYICYLLSKETLLFEKVWESENKILKDNK